jgi:formylglycine-generating enzyme required for sulfatase activity
MTNSLTKIFDTIGFSFRTKNNFFIPVEPIKGYNSLNSSHLGYYIPYLVRNYSTNGSLQYEVGVGYVSLDGTDIVVDRYKVVKSSSNDQKVDFAPSAKSEFYVFANESNFNTGFNNVIVKNCSFAADAIQAIYLLDASKSSIDIVLPSNDKSDNLVLEFKLIAGENPVIIRDSSGSIIYSLSYSSDRYTKLAFNNVWYHIKEDKLTPFSAESFDENTFSSQANAAGDIYSFQYNSDGTSLAGSKMYWSSGNTNKLLLGSSSESLAHTIIPTSGSGNVIFNNDRTSSDFIVYGSGNKNLWFTYDGRIGLNMPSGTSPQTIFHIVNDICHEGFRLENRSACHAANVTLYHKPSGNISNNSIVGELTLAGKNNASGNKIDYVRILSRAKDPSATPQGRFELVVESAGNGISTVISDPSATVIGYSNNNLVVSGNTSTKLGFPNTNLNLTSTEATLKGSTIKLQSQDIVFGSGNVGTVTLPSLVATNIQANNIYLPSIAPNTVLSTDSNGNVSAASATVRFPSIPAGRILTTDVGGSVTGVYRTDSFFYTDRDITWNKYAQRTASICLRQIILDAACPIEEFSVNDQIAIITNTQIFYRQITSLDISGNNIVGMLVNQNLTANTVSNVRIISITKGAYLNLEMYTEPGTSADATSIVLSLRPNKSTVFNAQHKDIDFLVYGLDNSPTLSVKANNGRSSAQSGEYAVYATHQRGNLFPVPVTIQGEGANNTNNSANYNRTASGLFSGMVTSVGSNGLPSYYGTYDQNGNVAEWVEDSSSVSASASQFAVGGSWLSSSVNALRSVIPYSVSSGYQDIGFRVSSSYGLVDNSYINSDLGLRFVSIGSLNNNADLSTIYTNSNSGTPVPSSINNLGVVNKNYRIGITETTNSQYVKFLNSVASTDRFGLYDPNMSGTLIGGISRSGVEGSYSYYTKTNMEAKPVVFVDYLSAIRFTNWLHNEAPTGTGLSDSVTEDGAYSLFSLGNNTYQVTKSPYQKYSLPSLNQWHKAAYFVPGEALASSGTSSVLIKRDTPQIINAGTTASGTPYINYASLSVSGWIYADKLRLGDGSFSSNIDDNDSSLSLLNGTLILRSGVGFQKASIGKQDNVTVTNSGPEWNGTYGNVISNTGVVLSANGDISLVSTGEIKLYSPQHIRISGISIDDLKYKNLIKVDQSGVPSAVYTGALSGLLLKENTSTATATDIMIVANNKITMPDEGTNKLLYIDPNHAISSYSGIEVNEDGVTITSSLVVDSIRIGSGLEYYSGSILTHNGMNPATWEPAEYLKAEGILWNRYIKRPVMVYPDRLVFINSPSVQTLANEFSYSDTIAVINSDTRETRYVKAAYETRNIIDGDQPMTGPPTGLFRNGTELEYCPTINWSNNIYSGVSGYAYSVTKGGYLSIQIEQENNADIQSSFSCSSDSIGYYKPSTLNTISTRPNQPTAFNLLGENIDFAIYGAKETLYHRYDAGIFGVGADGLPVGLSPALRVNAKVDNAVYGDASSGVYFSGYTNVGRTIPSGYLVDERAKVSINTNDNYLISSITSGANILGLYADLSVNGYTYSNSIISDNIYLRPLPNISGTAKYVINAPLTVNQYGQIISQMPESAPTIPGSPTSVIGEAGNSAITLNWVEPTNNGGRRIINYLIEYSVNQGALWTTYAKPVSSSTSLSITGLTNSVEYLFRVSAINSIGTGAPSLVSSGITPLSNRPSQPRSLSVSRASLSATLTWTVPIYGSPTNYIVEYSSNNGNTWSTYPDPDTISTSTTVTITGLSDFNRYIFRVKAENANGYGAYVEVISLGTDPYDPPTDPVNDNTSLWDFGKITFTGVCV